MRKLMGRKKPGGRPVVGARMILNEIFCVLRTGRQWKMALRGKLGASAFPDRVTQGVFGMIWAQIVQKEIPNFSSTIAKNEGIVRRDQKDLR